MRILFVMPHQRHARRYEMVLAELLDRGHEVELGLKGAHHHEADEIVDRLSTRGRLSRSRVPAREDRWAGLAEALRRGIDYLRYLGVGYEDAPKLRRRAAGLAPAWVVRAAAAPLLGTRTGRRALDALLRQAERAVPDCAAIVELLAERRPDLVAVSPLVDRPWQSDYLRAARSLGLRSALCVASWDNLTNKGLIRDVPDRVYVWNDEQRREAVELHGVARERVVLTGAHSFDHWFAWRPATDARGLRRRAGLADDDRPLLLYVASSQFIAPDEPAFVAGWLERLRAHADSRLAQAAVLIRPHPTTGADWEASDLDRDPGTAIWPRRGAVHVDDAAKSDFFDSIHHSALVVGVNTSALIESAIVGRPVFTVLDPRFAETQTGTLHFHYLLSENAGPLTVADDFGQHFEQLSAALAAPGGASAPGEFVRSFVRPCGLGRPAAQVMADALEAQVAQAAPSPAPARARRRIGALALRPLAARTSGA